MEMFPIGVESVYNTKHENTLDKTHWENRDMKWTTLIHESDYTGTQRIKAALYTQRIKTVLYTEDSTQACRLKRQSTL